MTDQQQSRRGSVKRRVVSGFHRYVANPAMKLAAGRIPGMAVIENTGRHSGLARKTPVGGIVEGGSFWLVSDHGLHSHYVKNMAANPRVRVQLDGKWHAGTAHLLHEDDPRQRLERLPAFNSMMVRMLATDMLTVRIDLDPAS